MIDIEGKNADEKKDTQIHIFRLTVGSNQILKGGKNPEILLNTSESSLCRECHRDLFGVWIRALPFFIQS